MPTKSFHTQRQRLRGADEDAALPLVVHVPPTPTFQWVTAVCAVITVLVMVGIWISGAIGGLDDRIDEVVDRLSGLDGLIRGLHDISPAD